MPNDGAKAGGLRAALRYHAAGGARVALRNSVLGTMGAVIVMGSAPRPPGMFRPLALGTAGADTSPMALVLVALAAIALARQGAPQLAAGHAGWTRSLPMSEPIRRRALVGALMLAQAPLLVFVACAVIVVLRSPVTHLSAIKLLACALIVAGAAMFAAPSGRRVAVALVSLVGIAGAATATIGGLAGSIAALALADRLATIAPVARAHTRTPFRTAAALLPYRIAWRAIGWRGLGALVPAALAIAFAWLMCDNNAMRGDAAATVMRTAGTIAVSIALAGLAGTLQLNRPPWAWARSLPQSAQQRVWHDAVALLAPVVPLWLAVAAVHLLAGVAVLAISPLVALVATAAMRRAGARITGTPGEVIAVGVLLSVAVSRSWLATLVCVAATPLALRLAIRRERALVATQWSERHHRTAGDAVAWTSR